MTAPAVAPVTLDEVRNRFVRAESSLNELVESLDGLRKSSGRFDDARGGLQRASEHLIELAGRLATAATELKGGTELLRQGVAALEYSEPARVLGEISQITELSRNVRGAVEAGLSENSREIVGLGTSIRGIEALVTRIEHATALRAQEIQGVLTTGFADSSSQVSEVTESITALSRNIESHAAAARQARDEIISAQKRTLLAVIGAGVVVAALQVAIFLR